MADWPHRGMARLSCDWLTDWPHRGMARLSCDWLTDWPHRGMDRLSCDWLTDRPHWGIARLSCDWLTDWLNAVFSDAVEAAAEALLLMQCSRTCRKQRRTLPLRHNARPIALTDDLNIMIIKNDKLGVKNHVLLVAVGPWRTPPPSLTFLLNPSKYRCSFSFAFELLLKQKSLHLVCYAAVFLLLFSWAPISASLCFYKLLYNFTRNAIK